MSSVKAKARYGYLLVSQLGSGFSETSFKKSKILTMGVGMPNQVRRLQRAYSKAA